MSYQPHLHKGGELYHYRTKGSKNGVSNTPGYRAIGKKAIGFLNSAGQYVYNNASKAAGSAGNWLSDRGRDVSKVASSAKKYASNAVSNIGSSAKKAAKYVTGGSKARDKVDETKFRLDVAKTYGGSTKTALASSHNQRKAANSRKTANNYEKSYANRSILDFRGQNSDAKGAIKEKNNAKKYQKAADENKALNNQIKREQVADARANYNKAIKEYNNTLEGKVFNAANKAKKSASKALNDAGKKAKKVWDFTKPGGTLDKTAFDTAKKAGESVSKFASDSFNSAKKSASKAISGAGKSLDSARKSAGNWLSDRGKQISKAASNAKEAITGQNAKSNRDFYRSMSSNSSYTTPYEKLSPEEKQVRSNRQRRDQRKIDEYSKQYNNSLAGRIDNASKAAGNAISKAGKNISNTAKKAKKTASKAISGAGKAAGRAAKTVGNFASTSFSSAKKAVGSGANRAGEFISGLFGKKKSKKSRKPTRSKK